MEIHPSWDCSGKIPHSVSPFPPHPFLSSVSDGRRAEPSSWSGRKSGGRLNVALMICSSSTARISYMNCVSPQSPKCILERLWAQMPEKTFIYFSFFSFFFFPGWQHFINTGVYSSPLACVLPSRVHEIGLYTTVSNVISYWEFSCINKNVIYLI